MYLPKKNAFSKDLAFHTFPALAADARPELSVEVPFHHINLTPACQLLIWFTQNIRMHSKAKIHIILLTQAYFPTLPILVSREKMKKITKFLKKIT
jgi:hypothetical protein